MEVQPKGESVTEDRGSEDETTQNSGPTAEEIDGPVSATNDGSTSEVPLPWNVSSDDETATDAENGAQTAADSDDEADPPDDGQTVPERFEELRFIGPKSAAALRDSSVTPADFVQKRIAYRDLTEAGVNPGVAAKIRREHSLSWSLDGGGTDLDRRSAQVRGLDDDERAWIAASSRWSDADAATETDGSGDTKAAEAAWRDRGEPTSTATSTSTSTSSESTAIEAESAWRARSVPTPVTALDSIDTETAHLLKRAGIGSVRRLATADPESVADALDVDEELVGSWVALAQAYDQ